MHLTLIFKHSNHFVTGCGRIKDFKHWHKLFGLDFFQVDDVFNMTEQ